MNNSENQPSDDGKDELPVIKPIPTYYNGYLFRSRMEARWAVFFNCLKIQAYYEPQGFKLSSGVLYLPDFYLPRVQLYAEVKPYSPTLNERRKCIALVRDTRHGCLLLEGPPGFRSYDGYLWDCGEITAATFLLDIDYHRRVLYAQEHRLFCDPPEMGECEFSLEYRDAVEVSRLARFDAKPKFPDLGNEPFNPPEGDLEI